MSFFQEKGLQTSLKIAGAETISSAEHVDIGLLVEVVAVLTDVVQLCEDGGVVFPTTFIRHASIPFAVVDRKGSVGWIFCQHGQPWVKWLPGPGLCSVHHQ